MRNIQALIYVQTMGSQHSRNAYAIPIRIPRLDIRELSNPFSEMAALELPFETGHSRDRYERINYHSIFAIGQPGQPPSIRGLNGPIFSRTHCGGSNANGWSALHNPLPPVACFSSRLHSL